MKTFVTGLLLIGSLLNVGYGIDVVAEDSVPARPPRDEVKGLSLSGEIDGENIVFTLTCKVLPARHARELPLVVGDTAFLSGDFPSRSYIVRRGDQYVLMLPRLRRAANLTFQFASRPVKAGDWRKTQFRIPASSTRKLAVTCDRDDLEVRFPGALEVRRAKTASNRTRVTAYLGNQDHFEVTWKPEIRRLDSELVVACDANTIATASVGAMRFDTILTYRVIQGRMTTLSLDLPDINITRVHGEDIQVWRVEPNEKGGSRLVVALGRPKDSQYRLSIESEMALPPFPSEFDLPVLIPRDVIRHSGFLLIGTESAIKLQITKAAGLTQVDQAAFPMVTLEPAHGAVREKPTRSAYAYQYASTPQAIEISADDIVTSFIADERLILSLAENELTFVASIELEVKEAPLREVYIEIDPDPSWTVTSVSGQNIVESDVDVRESGERRTLYIPLKQAVTGSILLNIRMERSLGDDAVDFAAPRFAVLDAKTERGYLVVAAEKGVRLKASVFNNMREVFTGSAPMRVPGAQQAFRFKTADWNVELAVTRAHPSIHSEVFHLVSLGEGVMYYSAAITYHIGSAPVQEFKVRVPEHIESAEFTGADIESWKREGDIYTVRLQTRTLADYTLLVSYDRQFPYESALLAVGEIETVDTESEVGYIAVASSGSIKLTEVEKLPDSLIAIDRDEIPTAYSAAVTDPILGSYKYVRSPHRTEIRVEPYRTEQLLGQVADFTKLTTVMSRDGECVTKALFYIKNTSRQFLIVRLPKDAKLWSIQAVEVDGKRTDLLSQESDAGILIPVQRPRDPNTPMQLEVTYAESRGSLGYWQSGFKGVTLSAPSMPDTHATFANWHVTVPEGFTIAGSRGNMTAENQAQLKVISEVLKSASGLWLAVLDGPGNLTFGHVLASSQEVVAEGEFTRSIILAGEKPPTLTLSVVPAWMGGKSSARVMSGALAIGFLCVVAGAWRKANPSLLALGLTVVLLGLSQFAAGRAVLGLLLAIVMGVVIGILLARGGLRLAWRLLLAMIWPFRMIARQLIRAFARKRAAGKYGRTAAMPTPLPAGPVPFEPVDTGDGGTEQDPSTRDGFTLLRTLVVLALLSCAVHASWAKTVAQPHIPVMRMANVSIEGPGMDPDQEQSAAVVLNLAFSVPGPTEFGIIPADGVLTHFDPESKYIDIVGSPTGYAIRITRKGEYHVKLRYRTPVQENDGKWSVTMHMPPNLRNQVTLSLPATELDVQSESAVIFRMHETNGMTQASAVFGPTSEVKFTWQPRIRKTALEEAVLFCDVNTLVALRSGVVDLTHRVRYQIAQGEIKEMKLTIPSNMSVTAVRAANLATWSFDPEKRLLEVILDRAVSGTFDLNVVTQVASDGVPYRVTIGAPRVVDAVRQRGAIAFAAPNNVQVRLPEIEGLSAMNIEDFPASTGALQGVDLNSGRGGYTIRKAYRYHDPDKVQAAIETEIVLPEIRVQEMATLSIADERIVLSTKLKLNVTKAGVFSVSLEVPHDYEVETLTGPDVSHWDDAQTSIDDELDPDAPAIEAQHKQIVTVHFNRQVADATELNIVIARTEKGIESRVIVPRVKVSDVRKHTGRLTISGERGVRLMVEDHRGVDIRKASEEGIQQSGVHVFDILRPSWEIALATEVLEPLVRPDVLQWIDLTEGMLQCRAFIRYRIENAGVKKFIIRSPVPGITLTVSGRNVARVHEIDAAAGLWQVDLHKNVENHFAVTATYQIPYDPSSRTVRILPLQTVNTDPQQGYLVLTCGDRIQVERTDNTFTGLKIEDPRNIPAEFGAGDLSGAIQCYRTVRSDFNLTLSVVRHDSADVLPATINEVRMVSAVSAGGRLLTQMSLSMRVGNLRFLEVELPNKGDALWTVLVNGKEVAASREKRRYYIPLEEQDGESTTQVQMTYAGAPTSAWRFFDRDYLAPKFGLPLNNIEWTFFVPAGRRYHGFGGTMERRTLQKGSMSRFDSQDYMLWNAREREMSIEKAREVLNTGNTLKQAGRQRRAKRAFQQALNYSHAQEDLNEDARIQLRNLEKQQWKMGFINRRDAVKMSRNIYDDEQANQMAGFNDGDFTEEYASQVESNLDFKDNAGLELVADKMIGQQAAAAGVVTAIRVTMPEHGQKLEFVRALHIDPDADVSVSFRVTQGSLGGLLGALLPLGILFGIIRMLLLRARR